MKDHSVMTEIRTVDLALLKAQRDIYRANCVKYVEALTKTLDGINQYLDESTNGVKYPPAEIDYLNDLVNMINEVLTHADHQS